MGSDLADAVTIVLIKPHSLNIHEFSSTNLLFKEQQESMMEATKSSLINLNIKSRL